MRMKMTDTQTASDGMCLPEQAQGRLCIKAATTHLLFVRKRREEERRRGLAGKGKVRHIWWCGCKCAETLRVCQELRIRDRS
jgi:hypothetical protein